MLKELLKRRGHSNPEKGVERLAMPLRKVCGRCDHFTQRYKQEGHVCAIYSWPVYAEDRRPCKSKAIDQFTPISMKAMIFEKPGDRLTPQQINLIVKDSEGLMEGYQDVLDMIRDGDVDPEERPAYMIQKEQAREIGQLARTGNKKETFALIKKHWDYLNSFPDMYNFSFGDVFAHIDDDMQFRDEVIDVL